MRINVIGMVAALALVLAACESTSDSGAGASGTGGNTGGSARAMTMAEKFQVEVGDRVFFAFDKFNVEADQKKTLDRQAAWLKANSGTTITIEGHADERGTREYNLALGERRANAVKDYLVVQGINASRIKVVSYGEERPVALGSDETAWAQNRRAVTVVGGSGS